MVRETSIAAYAAVQASGLVARLNRIVYNTFYETGPMTSAECYSKMSWMGSDQRGNIRARVHELVKMKLLKELGKRKCSKTGNTVYFYDVTSNYPDSIELPKRHKCHHCDGRGYTLEFNDRFC